MILRVGGDSAGSAEEDAMNGIFTWKSKDRRTGSWDLGADATMRVRPGRHGTVLRVQSGLVVVTQERDREDHVLAPGEELRVPPGGLVAAWALASSRLLVEDAPRPHARPLEPRTAAA